MRSVLSRIAAAVVLLVGCGGGDDADHDDGSGRRSVVVTTGILGELVRQVVGDTADVDVVMPDGADPHDFAPSARQAEAIADADVVVAIGGGYEEALESSLARADELFLVTDHVDVLDGDPHVWLDPARMAAAVEALGDELDAVERAAAVADDLRAVDAEVEALLAPIPRDRRVLVTNHRALTYFADRYGFDVVGAVITSPTTGAEPSAADLEDLTALIAERGVPAIFTETTTSSDVAAAVADAAGVDVVELHVESLGEPGSGADTYAGMLRSNAERVAGALR